MDQFAIGLNVPWNHCGNDYGLSWNATFFDDRFAAYSNAGATMARVWLMYNTNKTLQMYDPETLLFLPLTTGFLDDVGSMLDIAASHKISVIASLLSFECADYAPCRNMLESSSARQEFLTNAIEPLSTLYSTHPALHSWEIINEPEWMIENSGVSVDDVRAFHADVTRAFHESSSSSIVTTGSASWKWSSSSSDNDAQHQPVGDYWIDLGLDYYQVHFYSWMTEGGNDYDAFSAGYTPGYYHKSGQSVMLGEAPGAKTLIKGVMMSTCDLFKMAYENGYSGLLLWSDNANDGVGSWGEIEEGIKCFLGSMNAIEKK